MGVLNLMIDNAPTNPSDNASEDLTTEIIRKVIIPIVKIVLPIDWDLEI
jgi:hypothetical protein